MSSTSTFVPEHLRDEEPLPAPVFAMHPKREELERLSPLTRMQFKRTPAFVQRSGIGYAIKEGFVNSENPFSVRRVVLPTQSEKCLFEFDPNVSDIHISDQLATKVEQALGDTENGRVELFSNKHGKYLSELSHATILSDINFAKDVAIERRPDQPMRDPSVLVGALARVHQAPVQVDEAEEFAREISNNIGAHVSQIVVVHKSPASWGDKACAMAKNRAAVKHVVIHGIMSHHRYGGCNFAKYVRSFGCHSQYMINTLSTLLSRSLCSEAAMCSLSHCVNVDKLRCTLAKRVSEAMRCGLLGWMRASALRCRKRLRDKACYRDVDEDACGLREARTSSDDEDCPSDHELSSSDDECVDPLTRRMQRPCKLCHLPRFRCRCNNAYALPTDCYGRIDAQVMAPRKIGRCSGKKKHRRGRKGVQINDEVEQIGCNTCPEGKKKAMKKKKKQRARTGATIASAFEDAIRANDPEEMDRLIQEAKVGGSFSDMWARLKHNNPFRRRCGPCDDPLKDAAEWYKAPTSEESAEASDYESGPESEAEEFGEDMDSDFGSEAEGEMASEYESGPETEDEDEEEEEEAPEALERDTVTVETAEGPVNMTRGEFERLMEQGVVTSEGGRRSFTSKKIGAKWFSNWRKKNAQPKERVKTVRYMPKEPVSVDSDDDGEELEEYVPSARPAAASSSSGTQTFYDENGENAITIDKNGNIVGSRYLVDEDNEPESSKIFEAMWKRNSTKIASAVNPSGDAMDSYVFMPHDRHPNIKEFISLNKGGNNEPLYNYFRSASIEVPKGTKLASIASKLSVDGKQTYSVTAGGFAVNDMQIGYDMQTYGKGNIHVVPSSFIVKQK